MDAEKWVAIHFPNLRVSGFQRCTLSALNATVGQLVRLAADHPTIVADLTRLIFGDSQANNGAVRRVRAAYLDAATAAEASGDIGEVKASCGLAKAIYPVLWAIATGETTGITVRFNAVSYRSQQDYLVGGLFGENTEHLAAGRNTAAMLFTHMFAHLVVFWLEECRDEIERCTIETCDYVNKWMKSPELRSGIWELGSQSATRSLAEAFVDYYHSDEPDPVSVDAVNGISRICQLVEKLRSLKREAEGSAA